MYACNKNVELAIHSSSGLITNGQSKAASSTLILSIFTPNALMIAMHANGSLNQWAVSFAKESAFSTVLSVSHK